MGGPMLYLWTYWPLPNLVDIWVDQKWAHTKAMMAGSGHNTTSKIFLALIDILE